MKKKSLSLLIAVAMATTMVPSTMAFADTTAPVEDAQTPVEEVTVAPASTYAVTYDTHIQSRGWNKSVKVVTGDQEDITAFKDAGTSGTIGRSLRVEALKVSGVNLPEGASIEYRVHQQSFGWSKTASNGEEAGVTGKGKRAEAVQITLKGMPGYAIKYQVHVQSKGWMDAVTTENGTEVEAAKVAGTTGESKRIEAIRIQIVKTDAEKTAEVAAINAVAKAEATKTAEDIEAAKEATAAVKDTTIKSELTGKIDAIKPGSEEDEVVVEGVEAVNEKIVELTGVPETMTEETLKDKKVTLQAGETTLTATYVEDSLKDGKAEFLLDDEAELADATEYVVSADWATITANKFVARVEEAYIKEVSAVTTGISAAASTDVYFTAKNQYGEDIDLADKCDEVKVSATVNGVPLKDTEVNISNIEDGYVTVTPESELVKGDKLVLNFTNKVNDATIDLGTVSYTVEEAAQQVATTIASVAAKYTNSENDHKTGEVAEEVMPDDQIELTPDVRDQYSNPIANEKVRWVIEEGADLVTNTSGSPLDEKQDAESLEFKATKTGTFKVTAYITNGEKVTYEVEIGAKKLTTLTTSATNVSSTSYNLDENIIKEITSNDGAKLTADMIKFDVKAASEGVEASDVTVSAKVRGGDGSDKDDIVIVAKSSKAGSYKITPYVGESLEKATAKAAEITYTSTVDQTVASIDDISFNSKELKTGKDIVKDIVFKNKHGEVVVPSSADVAVTPSSGATASVTKVDDKNVLTINATEAKTYQVTVNVGDVIAPYKLTFAAPTLTKVDANADVSGVVAGDGDTKAKYQEVKFYDQDNETMNVKKQGLKVTVKDAKGATVDTEKLITLGKTYSVAEDGQVTFEEANDSDAVVAYKVAPAADLEAGKYTVKVEDVNNSKVSDTFVVTVGAKRETKTVDVTAAATKVALNGTTTIKIVPKDQYGELVAVGTDKIEIKGLDGLAIEGSVEEDQNDDGVLVGYKATLKASAKVSGDVEVNVKNDSSDVIATNKVNMTVDSVGNLVNSVEIDNNVKSLYKAGGTADLTAIAKASNGDVIPVATSDLNWEVVSQKDSEGKDVEVTASVSNGQVTFPSATKGSVVVKVTTSNDKEGTIELNFSDAASEAVLSTLKLENTVPDKVVDADDKKDGIQVYLDGDGEKDGESKGAVTFKLAAKDQYGDDFDFSGASYTATVDDSSVASVEGENGNIKITAKGAGTANVYVTYKGSKIKIELSVSQAAVQLP